MLLRAIQKAVPATGDLIGDKIADRIKKISKTSSKDNSESNEKKILRKRFILSELRHKITDDLGLKKQNY